MIHELTIPFIFWAAGRRYDCVNHFTTATQSLNADPDGTSSPDGSTDRTSRKDFPQELPGTLCARRHGAPSSRLKVGAVSGRFHEKRS